MKYCVFHALQFLYSTRWKYPVICSAHCVHRSHHSGCGVLSNSWLLSLALLALITVVCITRFCSELSAQCSVLRRAQTCSDVRGSAQTCRTQNSFHYEQQAALSRYADHGADAAPVSTLCMRRNVKEVLENDPDAYYNNEELLEPLKLMYRSLMATNDDGIANGRLLDVLRQVRPRLVCLFHDVDTIACRPDF